LTKDSLAQKASVTTLTAKVETLNNNLERQKKNEKELQVNLIFIISHAFALALAKSKNPLTCFLS
jgi:hypothetical protein